MQRLARGSEEMHILRQGLYVTIHHGDAIFRGAEHTITGHERAEFEDLMWQIDELNGHNEDIRRLLHEQVERLAALTADDLAARSGHVSDVVTSAERFSVTVPARLREFLGRSPA
jgi:hypothetical protein